MRGKGVSQSGAKSVILGTKEGDTQIYSPESVLHGIHSKDDLESMLNWYAKPSIKMVCPDNVLARRRYIERIRPALRWYCKHLGVPTPRWLHDEYLPEWSEEEKKGLFGDKPMHVVEFERHGHVEPGAMKPPGKPNAAGPQR